ncbi:MAG TPA: type IV pilin protein [Burkholderiaceae bacterium]|nr:type IV pilin protein [Burkholderiaceae bacterium]
MQLQKHHRQGGVTLIELMIAVAIFAILASVAVPSYQESVRRSNRAEAIATLLEASNWMQRGYTVNNTYVGTTTATLQAAGLGQSPKSGSPKYNITLTDAKTTATGYELVATPANSDKCGTFLLDETGKRSLSGNTATAEDCWGGR